MATKKKTAKKKTAKKRTVTVKAAKVPARPTVRGTKKGLNAEEYVRAMAQKSLTGGCKVCCHPNIAKKLAEITEQMDAQRVKIPATQLLRDLKSHYQGFSCSDEKFRKHIRECMGRATS